jgi:hypothetical protein
MSKKIVSLFCGSRLGIPKRYQRVAYELGSLIARQGWVLKNGAGKGSSSMGKVTDGLLDSDGKAKGVIIERFLHLRHPRLKDVIILKTLPQRKRELLKADAFVIMPGAFGTLDELSEVLALKQAGFMKKPVVILNAYGFFDDLLRWFKKVIQEGFASKKNLKHFKVVSSPQEAIRWMKRALKP